MSHACGLRSSSSARLGSMPPGNASPARNAPANCCAAQTPHHYLLIMQRTRRHVPVACAAGHPPGGVACRTGTPRHAEGLKVGFHPLVGIKAVCASRRVCLVPGPRLREPVHLVLQVVLAGLHTRVAVRVLRHAVHAPHAAQPRLRGRTLRAAPGARAYGMRVRVSTMQERLATQRGYGIFSSTSRRKCDTM